MSVIAVSSGGTYIDLPDPAYGGYSTATREQSKAGRNTQGDLYKVRITLKKTITVRWVGLTAEQKNQIMSLTSTNAINVRYLDVEDDTVHYGKFYRGDEEQYVTPYLTLKGSRFGLYDVSMQLVEY